MKLTNDLFCKIAANMFGTKAVKWISFLLIKLFDWKLIETELHFMVILKRKVKSGNGT